MPSLNKVLIIGHLGKDPELRTTTSGKSVCNFSVAASEKYGEQEHTEWFNVQAWGKLAEVCNQYLKKGSLAYIEGRLNTRKWEDKDGNTRYSTEVIANQMLMLDRKQASGTPEPQPEGQDDDIPF